MRGVASERLKVIGKDIAPAITARCNEGRRVGAIERQDAVYGAGYVGSSCNEGRRVGAIERSCIVRYSQDVPIGLQ